MATFDKTIIWEKWKDPLGYDDENITDKLENYDDPVFYEEDIVEDNDYEDEEEDQEKKTKIERIREKFILTPLGIMPLNENTASSKIFNFWTGHSNFPITKNIASIIEDTDGVETLDIFTKYRFRIAVGKAFNDSEVMRDINQNVYGYLEKNV
jgi:hypothetical protein